MRVCPKVIIGNLRYGTCVRIENVATAGRVREFPRLRRKAWRNRHEIGARR